jgi:hypothetical protein
MTLVEKYRIDLLLLALAEHVVKNQLDPTLRMSVPMKTATGLVQNSAWEAGLGKLVAQTIQRAGFPTEPIRAVRLGQMTVPVEVVGFLAKLCGLDKRWPGC